MSRPLISLSLFVVLSLAVAADDFTTPTGRVEATVNALISILRDQALEPDARWKALAAVIDGAFDLRSLSQSVLARPWRAASLAERERFTDFFSHYLEETYHSGTEVYSDQNFNDGDERITGERAVVAALIVTDATEIPVRFKLKNNDGEWYAYDVIIEGRSLVSNYRSTVATIVKNEGMDGLLLNIQGRIDRHRAAAGEDAEAKADDGLQNEAATEG